MWNGIALETKTPKVHILAEAIEIDKPIDAGFFAIPAGFSHRTLKLNSEKSRELRTGSGGASNLTASPEYAGKRAAQFLGKMSGVVDDLGLLDLKDPIENVMDLQQYIHDDIDRLKKSMGISDSK